MKQLALVTWRLPHVSLPRLERSREALEAIEDRTDVFTFATCQRAIVCTIGEDPWQALDRVADEIDRPDGERFVGHEAFAHLARVAASLDALMPGEDQVPAQFRQALAAQEADLDAGLHERLQRVRSLARQARDAGGLCGHRGRSIVDLVEPLLPDEGPIAVVGTGTIAREAVTQLGEARPVHVVSRSRARAVELVAAPRAWSRSAFLAGPPRLAGIILSTSTAQDPVVDEEAGRRLAEARAGSDPLPIVDLGVPRNADPSLSQHPGIELSTLEELAAIGRASHDRDARIDEARRALEHSLAADRRRRRERGLDERVIALREELADELERLADEIPAEDLEAWLDRAHASLSHTSQSHLEAAIQGDPPP